MGTLIHHKDDDGFILYESRAIVRYLIKKYPNQGTTGLIPTDPKEVALFEQAASVEVSNFDAYAAPLAYEKVFKTYVYTRTCTSARFLNSVSKIHWWQDRPSQG